VVVVVGERSGLTDDRQSGEALDRLELGLPGRQLIEWGGALRWVNTTASAETVRQAAPQATLFRAADKSAAAFSPLEPVNARVHKALKAAFDPAGILNPGRLYEDF